MSLKEKGTRLKEREVEIRNKQIEANRELRLFEIKSNELGALSFGCSLSLYPQPLLVPSF
jgi:hypothetical protein